MTIKEAVQTGNKLLIDSSPTAELDSEVLLSAILHKNREFMLTHPETVLSDWEQKQFQSFLKRRAKHEPISYLIGYKEFYGLRFQVSDDALIPRPATEGLVAAVLSDTNPEKEYRILDVGTGSGCIAITLAKHFPATKIIASDIDEKALACARQNAESLKTEKQIDFIQSDLMEKITGSFDIICANLPYLSIEQWQNTSPTVKKFEPKKALLGGQHGFELNAEFLRQLPAHLNPGGKIYLEIDPASKEILTHQVSFIYPGAKTEIKKDLAGIDRVLVIKG